MLGAAALNAMLATVAPPAPWKESERMRELLRTNDFVLISFVESLMRDAGIEVLVLDQNMSVVEGSLGVLPRRILVADDHYAQARRLMIDAELADELG